jgi:drug/metabolite transporter (DMT)-like permease
VLDAALALGSSLAGGTSDFIAGTTSRRIGTLQFLMCVQTVGLVLAGGWVAISHESVPAATALVAAAGAGVGLMVNLGALFEAMVVGTISVVAPISATGVVLPVVIGIARGERPGPWQVAGMICAVAGIVLATRLPRGPIGGRKVYVRVEPGFALALVAAIGGGLFLWLMAQASRHGTAWAVLVVRAVSSSVFATAVATRRTSRRLVPETRTTTAILASALLGFFGLVLYAMSTIGGELAVVSVLASLYPAVTVLLAHRLLGERIRPLQQVGIGAVLLGVVLMSAT